MHATVTLACISVAVQIVICLVYYKADIHKTDSVYIFFSLYIMLHYYDDINSSQTS